MVTLPYGIRSQLSLDVPADALVAASDLPAALPLADLALAASASLAQPLDYPPLEQVAVPGDQVVLALGDGVPHAATIVAEIVAQLRAAGIKPRDMQLLRARDQGPDPLALVPAAERAAIRQVIHDADDRTHLSYLASSAEGKPIYVHRSLTDADLVIPIGCLRVDESSGYFGVYDSLFPTFSDAKTRARYRSPSADHSTVQHRRLAREASETSWLLGIHFLVAVLPGGGDSLLAVLAGRSTAVERVGRQRSAAAWQIPLAHRAGLIVASLTGELHQSWECFGRALAATEAALEEGGTIVLCTDLAEEAGPALRAVARNEDLSALGRDIARERPADALPAAQLIAALERGRIYLVSQLPASFVEELGMIPVERPEQVARLVVDQSSCLLLPHAQFAVPGLAVETPALGAPQASKSAE